ncbi:MAG: phospholipase D-like domain-containing protein [Thermodesulfovibrionales bacterium]|nr:phospholipase D-like domain-containing protein [Thermodesulfovibrionales bacterium]
MSIQLDNFTIPSIERIIEEKFSIATDIKLLWKGPDSFNTIFETVKEAKELICLAFYIFRSDETGRALAEILKKKSQEGVNVYVLYDHFGSFGTPRSFWKDMKAAGVKVRSSRPFQWKNPFRYVHRDHRKLIIIDLVKAFTGGLNIANEYSGFHIRSREKNWRDTGIMLSGPIVKKLFKNFEKSWNLWGDERIKYPINGRGNKVEGFTQDSAAIKLKGGFLTIPIFASSSKSRRMLRRLFYYSINRAKSDISITTAYFIPSKRMIETLIHAVKRGVRVRLLVPGQSDVPAASYAGRFFFKKLLNAGVEIYTYIGQILHAKTYLFDNCWSIIGSANLDFQSFRYNDEGNVGILSTDFASKMMAVFEEDLKNSEKIELEKWERRPFFEKVKERFFSLFKKRL